MPATTCNLVGAGFGVGDGQDIIVIELNQDGSFYTSFGTDGHVLTDFEAGYDQGRALVVQSDGKIVVAGYATISGAGNFAVVRYNADGSLDSTFGTGGKVNTSFGGVSSAAQAMGIQSDSKFIVGGHTVDGSSHIDFALARYNTDGTLDSTFGTGGKVTTDFGGTDDELLSIVVQPDGKIVVAGSTNSGGNRAFALARYNTDGTLDTGFGTSGKKIVNIGTEDSAYSLVLQSDGKIVAVGYATTGFLNIDFALVRFNTDGSLDTDITNGFGPTIAVQNGTLHTLSMTGTRTNGSTTITGLSSTANLLLNQSVTGTGIQSGSTVSTIDSGSQIKLNKTASSGGSGTLSFTSPVVTGLSNTAGFYVGEAVSGTGIPSATAISVINSSTSVTLNKNATTSGVSSLTFSTPLSNGTQRTGIVTTDFGTDEEDAFAVAIQSDGKIIAAGRTDTNGDSQYDFALARYNIDGTLDTTFTDGVSTPGLVVTDLGGDDEIFSILILDDGSIVVGGEGNGSITFAKYESTGALDPSFGTGGFFTTWLGGIVFGLAETCFDTPNPTPTPTPTPTSTTTPNVFGWSPSTDVPVESWMDRQSKSLNWGQLRKVLINVKDQDPYKLSHDTLIDYEDNTTHPV